MPSTAHLLTVAIAWALGGALAGWAVTMPARHSFAGQLARPVLVVTGASVAAFFGSLHAMYLPLRDFWIAEAVTLVAGGLAALVAAGGARRMSRDRDGVREAVRAMTGVRAPRADRPLTGELAALRAEIDDVAGQLDRARAQQSALESAHRELLSFLVRDLRVPLAQMEALLADLQSGAAEIPEQTYKQLHLEAETMSGMLDDLSAVADAPAPDERSVGEKLP